MIDNLEIHRFILSFNRRHSDDWNPGNVNLRKMLAEFALYAAQQSVHLTLGILANKLGFIYAVGFSCFDGFAVPAPAQVKQSVRPLTYKG